MRIAAALIVLAPAIALAKPISLGVIARDEPQFATRAEAAKATAAGSGDLISVRIVAEHGDVIEVSTAYTPDDCVAASDSGYALTVFVPRAALVPRVATPIIKTFTDGTGYTIYAGAPARVHGSSVELVEPFLRATGVVVPASSLAMSVVQKPATPLPTVGERLVCDPDLQSLDTWQKKIASKSDAKRKECEARLAAKPAPKPPAPKPPAKKPAKDALTNDLEAERFAELLTGSSDSCRPDPTEAMNAYPPPCLFNAAAKLELDGKATIPVSAGGGGEVSRSGTRTLVTLAATCGQIRASADPKLLRGSGGTGGGIAGLGGSIRWTPRPFTKVYWPDGKLAGTYNGHADYGDADIEQRKDMICVSVRGVQSKVCHRRKDVDHR